MHKHDELEAHEAEELRQRMMKLFDEWRTHAGLTSGQVAERMGIAASTLCRMEKNGHTCKLSTIERYAKACGVKLTISGEFK